MINGNHGKKYAVISEELYKTLRNMNQQVEQTQSPMFQKIKMLDGQIKNILSSKVLAPGQKAKLYSQIASRYIDLRNKAPETTRMMVNIPPEILDEPPPALPDEVHSARSTRPRTIPTHVVTQLDNVPQQPAVAERLNEEGTDDELLDGADDDDELLDGAERVNEPAIAPLPADDNDEFLDAANEPEAPMAIAAFAPPESTGFNAGKIIQSVGSDVRKGRAKVILEQIQKNNANISWHPKTGALVLNGKDVPNTYFPDIIDYISNHKPSKNPPAGASRFLQAMWRAKIDPQLVPNTELRNIMKMGEVQKGQGIQVKWEKY